MGLQESMQKSDPKENENKPDPTPKASENLTTPTATHTIPMKISYPVDKTILLNVPSNEAIICDIEKLIKEKEGINISSFTIHIILEEKKIGVLTMGESKFEFLLTEYPDVLSLKRFISKIISIAVKKFAIIRNDKLLKDSKKFVGECEFHESDKFSIAYWDDSDLITVEIVCKEKGNFFVEISREENFCTLREYIRYEQSLDIEEYDIFFAGEMVNCDDSLDESGITAGTKINLKKRKTYLKENSAKAEELLRKLEQESEEHLKKEKRWENEKQEMLENEKRWETERQEMFENKKRWENEKQEMLENEKRWENERQEMFEKEKSLMRILEEKRLLEEEKRQSEKTIEELKEEVKSLKKRNPGEFLCNICCENAPNVVFKCGHLICTDCSNAIKSRNQPCPTCSTPLIEMRSVYLP